MRKNKTPVRHTDGNVGAETATSRGYGDIRLWVESKDGYKHPLYVSLDEAERLSECLADLLDDLEATDAATSQ